MVLFKTSYIFIVESSHCQNIVVNNSPFLSIMVVAAVTIATLFVVANSSIKEVTENNCSVFNTIIKFLPKKKGYQRDYLSQWYYYSQFNCHACSNYLKRHEISGTCFWYYPTRNPSTFLKLDRKLSWTDLPYYWVIIVIGNIITSCFPYHPWHL